MPGPTRRRKIHQGITTEKKKYRTKRRRRDIDQIVEDLEEKRIRLIKIPTVGIEGVEFIKESSSCGDGVDPFNTSVSENLDLKAIQLITPHKDLLDLPGHGLHYCVYCSRHFIDALAKSEHERGKVHKKRVKETKEVPYSIAESEKAGGLGSYIAPPKIRPEILGAMES